MISFQGVILSPLGQASGSLIAFPMSVSMFNNL